MSFCAAHSVSGNYDRIARFYDVDMAQNMAYDDVGFYAGICRRRPGRVLELGCGNGRILLELITRGIDAIGVDSSGAMLDALRRRAAVRDLAAPVCRMDVRALAFRPGFDVILCPYSLVTYLTADRDVTRMLNEVREVLRPDGLLAVDAFVPRPIAPHAQFRPDYRRPFGEHFLARSKRIASLDRGLNRIERRYQVVTAANDVLEQVDIVEDIRPFQPEELRDRLADAGFAIDETWWNYALPDAPAGAQFFTVIARAPSAKNMG